MINKSLKIGFIGTRFAGTDGVSLEANKWVEVLEGMGHIIFYLAGECDRPKEQSMIVPEAFYRNADVKEHHDQFFSRKIRKPEETHWIAEKKTFLSTRLKEFIDEFHIEMLIVENALAIPLHIPLGIAITEIIAELGIPTIAHHHDMAWERKRFLVNCIGDYISMSFPPKLDSIQHVAINSQAQKQIALRCGVGAMLIPNVMNYLIPPPEKDEFSSDLRNTLGIGDDELFILQPTRIIERKGIEHAIELVHRLDMKAHLVVSHASGDEGDAYAHRIRTYAELLGVDLICADKFFGTQRGYGENGQKIYSIWDAYLHADLVTYPSEFEGFGNAFLEAIYFCKPIVVNNYSIYSTDIKPKGFEVVEFDEYVTDETIQKTRQVLMNKTMAKQMTEKNFSLAKRYFSYSVLEKELRILISNAFGSNNLHTT